MSFGNMVEKEARLEIGWSWLGQDFRGKGINRWAKFLLMQHAFEILQAQRVEFKTDVLNQQARAGLRNIGAREEGVLRSFNYMPDGRRRDAIFYSVLAAEWPEVKKQLLQHEKVVQHEGAL
jgi:RimJ/RimL family protein N-acetyltransferase